MTRSRRTPAQLLLEGERLLEGLDAVRNDPRAVRASIDRMAAIVLDVAEADFGDDVHSAIALVKLSSFARGFALAESLKGR